MLSIGLSLADLTGAEVDDVAEICRSQPDYWRSSGDQDPSTMPRDMLASVLRDDVTDTMLARDAAGRVVGFAQVLACDPVDGLPWIAMLMVDGRLARRGHGRAIVSALEDRLRAGGATAVHLGVHFTQPEAYAFWIALGYCEVDLRVDRVKGRPILIMERTL